MKGPVTEFGYPISIEFSNRNVPRKLAMDQEIAKKAGESLLFRILRKFKRALIIQENFDDTPDDEGSRPAGSITFDFKAAIKSFGFDLLDVEDFGAEPFSVDFTSPEGNTKNVSFADIESRDNTLDFGNNSANRIIPITAAQVNSIGTGAGSISSFDEVTINLGGSGAVDNIKYTNAVPEPMAVFVWAMIGVIGLFDNRRKPVRRILRCV